MGVEVTIMDGTATVRPASAEVARRLLDAAKGRDVRTSTAGALAFVVEESLARDAGLVHGGAPKRERPAPVEEPEEPNRGASRKVWSKFLQSRGVQHDEGLTRNELVSLWDEQA